MKPVVKVVQALALVAALAFVVLLFANEPDDAPAASTEASTPAGRDAGDVGEDVDGAEVFASSCARCHGSDGGGGTGPQLSGGQVVERFPDAADEIQIVRDGRGSMPAFAGPLSDAEIEAVVEHTRSL